MKTDLKSLLLQKIKKNNLKAFSCYDFVEFASYKTISKCLERMDDKGEIRRIIQGVYCFNGYDEVLKLPILPSVNDVAICIARKHGWTICPFGNLALNLLGLSTQVPANYTYLSNGPYEEYLIYDIKVTFKRRMNREVSDYSYKTSLLIQCIKFLGKDNIDNNVISTLKEKISDSDKAKALKETSKVQAWVRDIIVKICY